MEHICDKDHLILKERNGNILTYICPECGKEFDTLVSIVVPCQLPPRKCKLTMNWANDSSLVQQIHGVKHLFPNIKKSNTELLKCAKSNIPLEIGEMTLAEGRELLAKAKELNLSLVLTDL